MQKAYFRSNYYIYVAKDHPTEKETKFLFAKSITNEPDYFLGKLVKGKVDEAKGYRKYDWHIQKGGERLFHLMENGNLPIFRNVLQCDILHTRMTKKHSTKPKLSRNREIVIKRLTDPERFTVRHLASVYNIHWTTVQSILDRYSKVYQSYVPHKVGDKSIASFVGK